MKGELTGSDKIGEWVSVKVVYIAKVRNRQREEVIEGVPERGTTEGNPL